MRTNIIQLGLTISIIFSILPTYALEEGKAAIACENSTDAVKQVQIQADEISVQTISELSKVEPLKLESHEPITPPTHLEFQKKKNFFSIIPAAFVRSKKCIPEKGEASVYGIKGRDNLDWNETASGKLLDPSKLTAAHKTLPLGSKIRVRNLANGKEATLTITDRGPFAKGRFLDLTTGAAKALGMGDIGMLQIVCEPQLSATNSPKEN